MIVFADSNTLMSLQYIGSSGWAMFLLPSTFDESSLDSLTLDNLFSSHLGVVDTTLAASVTSGLRFNHKSNSMPNRVCGRTESEPSNSKGPLFRVGVNAVSGGTLYPHEKFSLLMDNASTLTRTLSVDAPERVITYDLNTEASIDHLDFTSNRAYTVECFTDSWIPFELGTKCSKIRITLGSGSVSCNNLVVYTNDVSAVGVQEEAIGYGVLVHLGGTESELPMLLVDVGDWKKAGTALVNETLLPAAHYPSLMLLKMQAALLEVTQ